MIRIKPNRRWVLWAWLTAWLLPVLILIVANLFRSDTYLKSASIIAPLTNLGSILTLPAIIVLIAEVISKRKPEPVTENPKLIGIAKAVAVLLVIGLAISMYAALSSFTIDPFGLNGGSRFVYENIARGLTVASIFLTLLLSAIQKDLYWVSKKSRLKLDERQLHQRQEVFEQSYKIAAWTLFICLVLLVMNTSYIKWLVTSQHFGGDTLIPFYNLVTFVFALPLVIAAKKTRR